MSFDLFFHARRLGAVRLLVIAMLMWVAGVTMAAASCSWPIGFTALGETKELSLIGCTREDDWAHSGYGGVYETLGEDALLDYGLGADGSENPVDEVVTTALGGKYTFNFNKNTALLKITLTQAPSSSPDVLTVYTDMVGDFSDGTWPTDTANTLTFTYNPKPTVTGITGTSGPDAGGTLVTMTGTNFVAGDTTVKFGSVNAASVTVNSATSLTATTPAGSGAQPITVTTSNGTSDATYSFIYIPLPTVTGVSPAGGLLAGGTSVVITGANLEDATFVNFGSNPASFTVLSETAISATSPVGTATVNVVVTTPGGTSATGSANAFQYVSAPVVNSVSVPANDTYRIGETLGFTVSFNQNVAVTGSPQLEIDIGGSTVLASLQSTSANEIMFGYTIQAGDSDTDGISILALKPNGASIRESVGVDADLTLNNVPNTTGILVDGIAPTVTSTASSGSPAASDTSMAFTVNFSEWVANVGAEDFYLGVTGTASGTISSVSSNTGSSINVNVVDISGNGTMKLNLSGGTNIQDSAGNSAPSYTSGSTHTVAVPTKPAAPTSVMATAGDQEADVAFTPPVDNGGSAITSYRATSSPGGFFATIPATDPNVITVDGLTNGQAYTFTVTATNSVGTSVLSTESNAVTPKADQTITFVQPSNMDFGAALTLQSSATSGLQVEYSSNTSAVCSVAPDGVLTTLMAGTCSIDASQSGSATFNAATTVSRTFSVNAVVPGQPTVGTAIAGNTDATLTFSAPVSTGGASITNYLVTADPGGATGTGTNSPIIVAGLTNGVPYTFTVKAENTAGLSIASVASNSVTPKASQSISFGNPGTQWFGTTYQVSATSDSMLAVTFTSSTPSVCTTDSAGNLTFVSSGSCTIHANQAGSSEYLAASQVSQTFTVGAVLPSEPLDAVATAGDTSASISFVSPLSTGGASITGYTVSVSPPDAGPVSGPSSPIVVPGLTNGVPYTFTVTADNSAGTSDPSVASNSVTPSATQIITFGTVSAKNFGTTPTLTATSDSGLNPVFSSETPGVCTILGSGELTFVSAGMCTITASQPGNGSYLPANPVSQSFTVNAVLAGVPVIGSATVIDGDSVSVSFTAPASTGGVALTGYEVTSNPGSIVATGSGSPIVIDGLTPGTSYTFNVTAKNSVGASTGSSDSNSVTPMFGQTISFTSSGADKQLYSTNTVTATATSGLPVSLNSTTTSVCTVDAGGVLTLLTTGACTIEATQAGDTGHDPAPPVTQSFNVYYDLLTGSPASGALPNAVAGTPYSQTISATGGNAPYSFSASSLPIGLSLDATSGVISGTPTMAGTTSVTVTITDDVGVFISIVYVMTVEGGTVTLTPASGKLGAGTLGQSYAASVKATGGTAPYTYAIDAGALPAGIVLDGASGKLSGKPTAAGHFAFSIKATDAYGSAMVGAYTIDVANVAMVLTPASGKLADAMAGEAYSAQLTAKGGTGTVIYRLASGTLPDGMILNVSTGELTGPLKLETEGNYSFVIEAKDANGSVVTGSYDLVVKARTTTVQDQAVVVPPGATPTPVSLTSGATGGPFFEAVVGYVLPPEAGTATVSYGDVAALEAAKAEREIYLKFAPNPEFAGTAVVGFTLNGVIGSASGKVTFEIQADPEAIAEKLSALSQTFVQTRASLLAGAVDAPGLQERRSLTSGGSPGSFGLSPAENALTMNVATSTAQLAAWDAEGQGEPLPLNFWIDATATLHVKTQNEADEHWGSFALVSMGADYLVNEALLVGLAVHADWMEDLTDTSDVTGNGVLIGPYVSMELGQGVFFDASLYYGRSWNEVSGAIFAGTFETERVLGKASLTGQWALTEALTLRPQANAFYLHESAGDYEVSNGSGGTVALEGFSMDQLRLSAGGTLDYVMGVGEGLTLKPFIGLQLGLSVTDGVTGSFATLSGGFDLLSEGNWTLGGTISADLESEGLKAISAKARLSGGF